MQVDDVVLAGFYISKVHLLELALIIICVCLTRLDGDLSVPPFLTKSKQYLILIRRFYLFPIVLDFLATKERTGTCKGCNAS